MPLNKNLVYSFNHTAQIDKLYQTKNSAEIKAAFDSRGNELRDYVFSLVDVLLSTTNDSGASNIKARAIPDLSGDNVQTLLDNLVAALRSTTDNAAGADYVKATAIDGLTGDTVQNLIEALKAYIDSYNTRHKLPTSSDHDNRYYTETELDNGILDNRYYTETELNNGALDIRYYPKTAIDAALRTGDTIIKIEVYKIISANNGDGTFTYEDTAKKSYTGVLTGEGYQVFNLVRGIYPVGQNRISVIVGDTLKRSAASGGIIEIDERNIALTMPEGNGAEITIEYFEKLGMAGEHSITHEVNNEDEIAGLCYVGSVMPKKKVAFWFKVV